MNLAIKHACFQVYRLSPLSLLLVGALLSCGNLAESGLNFNFSLTRIADVQQKRQLDTDVYLKGTVSNRVPFLGTGAYLLEDGTGRIWVLTKQVVPFAGEEMLIKGQVRHKSITLKEMAGKDLGEIYVEELEQLKRTPVSEKEKKES